MKTESVRLLTFNVQNVWSKGKEAGKRGELTAKMLLESRADVVCLQEYDNAYRDSLNNLNVLLSPVYTEVFLPDTDCGDVWNPIFYRKERFTVGESGMVDMFASGVPCYENLRYPSGNGRSHFRTLVWAFLKEKGSGDRIAVANVHFSVVGKEKNNIFSHEKEVEFVLPTLKEVSAKTPLLVCGDYNASFISPDRACSLLAANGFYDTRDLAAEKNDVRSSTCGSADWSFDGPYRSAVDHVYTSRADLAVDSYFAMPDRAVKDGEHLSDHCPTVVEFQYPKFVSTREVTRKK